MQELCTNCPLHDRQVGGMAGEDIVELTRGRADDPEERAAILSLPAGEAILNALGLPRPERCTILDRTLPGYRSRHAATRGANTTDCPEVALGAQLQTEFPETVPEALR